MTEALRLEQLRSLLEDLNPGPVPPERVRELERMLYECWDELEAHDGGLQPHKLLGRTEEMCWDPPVLEFAIERHGATVLGSIHGEVQYWTVDVRAATATISLHTRKRRLYPARKAMNTAVLAGELAELVLSGREDPRLQWRKDRNAFRVRTSVLDPGAPAQTRDGRARRLRRDLVPLLVPRGWNLSGGWWKRAGDSGNRSA